MPKADALATIAYCILSARGQANTIEGPSLHDITCAVVQAAPLLELSADVDAPGIEISATSKLIERHRWSHPTVVRVTQANGYEHKPPPNDNTPRKAGR